MASTPPKNSDRRPAARVVGTAVFGLFVATLTAVFSVQIILQAWNAETTDVPDCRIGVRSLFETLNQARQSAARETGELEALHAFRRELSALWDARPALERACTEDPSASRLLNELQRLRYAEEHAVRYESRELAVQRRTVQALAREMFGKDGSRASDQTGNPK